MARYDSGRPFRLLGPAVDPSYYDDEAALTEYVWRHFQRLMSPLELRVGLYSVPIVSGSDADKMRRVYEYCESHHGHVDDQDVIDAFKMDRDDFLLRVRQRLLDEDAEKIFVNRCPECSRIVRSPRAQQCPWCKHDWHGT